MAIFNNFFGFSFKKSKEEKREEKRESFTIPDKQDGATTIESSGAWGTYIDLDGTAKNDFELITRYREMALFPEVDSAIDDIINESIVSEDNAPPVKIDLSDVELSDKTKNLIEEEFDTLLQLLDFTNQGYEVFRRWYVDGRLYYHIIIDENAKNKGIQELRYIDPRQVQPVREIQRDKDGQTGADLIRVVDEYFLYNNRGITYNANTIANPLAISATSVIDGLRIEKDCILYSNSGITDRFSKTVLSHLHKAVKPVNQLKMMEDSMVIYRISRAPERRVFYIDVGNLPKSKAEDYLRSVMQKFRNKLVYDIHTGSLRDEKRHLSMMEDFFLPRREGSQGTQIQTLPGGENLDQIEDIKYFQQKLYRSLNVPISRLESEKGFNLGRASEITRDEIKFAKFIRRLRTKFCQLFLDGLRTQLILKGITTKDDWDDFCNDIKFLFEDDNHFSELKDIEIMKERIGILQQLDPGANYAGKYYSVSWIRENVLKQTREDQKILDKEIDKEKNRFEDPQFINTPFGPKPRLPFNPQENTNNEENPIEKDVEDKKSKSIKNNK